jgi:decaprenylphospho-beta-D-erythro-pentofuranosid-2-ulose 2-reductase
MQTVLVLGGNSEIALAIVDRLIEGRTRRVVLAVREPAGAQSTLDRLTAAGVTASAIAFDALKPETHATVLKDAFAGGDIDLVISAFGILGPQVECDADPMFALQVVNANFGGAVTSSLIVADLMRRQGHGTLLMITSIAAMRGRADNYVYGSTKAGQDLFAHGLGDSLVGSGVRVVVVRPGFVHTKMTDGMKPAPFSTTPEEVAEVVVDGLAKGRELIFAPSILRFVFAGLIHAPRMIWRRLGG